MHIFPTGYMLLQRHHSPEAREVRENHTAGVRTERREGGADVVVAFRPHSSQMSLFANVMRSNVSLCASA